MKKRERNPRIDLRNVRGKRIEDIESIFNEDPDETPLERPDGNPFGDISDIPDEMEQIRKEVEGEELTGTDDISIEEDLESLGEEDPFEFEEFSSPLSRSSGGAERIRARKGASRKVANKSPENKRRSRVRGNEELYGGADEATKGAGRAKHQRRERKRRDFYEPIEYGASTGNKGKQKQQKRKGGWRRRRDVNKGTETPKPQFVPTNVGEITTKKHTKEQEAFYRRFTGAVEKRGVKLNTQRITHRGQNILLFSYEGDPNERQYRLHIDEYGVPHVGTFESNWNRTYAITPIVKGKKIVSAEQRLIDAAVAGKEERGEVTQYPGIFAGMGMGKNAPITGQKFGEGTEGPQNISSTNDTEFNKARVSQIIESEENIEGYSSSPGSKHHYPTSFGRVPGKIPGTFLGTDSSAAKAVKRGRSNWWTQTVLDITPGEGSRNITSPITTGYNDPVTGEHKSIPTPENLFQPGGGARHIFGGVVPEGMAYAGRKLYQEASTQEQFLVPVDERTPLNVEPGQVFIHNKAREIRKQFPKGKFAKRFNLVGGDEDLFPIEGGNYHATRINKVEIEEINGKKYYVVDISRVLTGSAVSEKTLSKFNIALASKSNEWVPEDTIVKGPPSDAMQLGTAILAGLPKEKFEEIAAAYNLTRGATGLVDITEESNAPGFLSFVEDLYSGKHQDLLSLHETVIETEMSPDALVRFMGKTPEEAVAYAKLLADNPAAFAAMTGEEIVGKSANLFQPEVQIEGKTITFPGSEKYAKRPALEKVEKLPNGNYAVVMNALALDAPYYATQLRPEQGSPSQNISIEELEALYRKGGQEREIAISYMARFGKQIEPFWDYTMATGALNLRDQGSKEINKFLQNYNIVTEKAFASKKGAIRDTMHALAGKLYNKSLDQLSNEEVQNVTLGALNEVFEKGSKRQTIYNVGGTFIPQTSSLKRQSRFDRTVESLEYPRHEMNRTVSTAMDVISAAMAGDEAEPGTLEQARAAYEESLRRQTSSAEHTRGLTTLHIPAAAGAILASNTLAANEVAVTLAGFRKMVAGGDITIDRTDWPEEFRDKNLSKLSNKDLLKLASEKRLTGLFSMYPSTSDEMTGIPVTVRLQEEPDLNLDVEVEGYNIVASRVLAAALNKDIDSDRAALSAATKDVFGSVAQTAGSIIRRALRSPAGEYISDLVKMRGGKRIPGIKSYTVEELEEASRQEGTSKRNMGIVYNTFRRGLVDISSSYGSKTQRAAQDISEKMYQTAVDMLLDEDAASNTLLKLTQAAWMRTTGRGGRGGTLVVGTSGPDNKPYTLFGRQAGRGASTSGAIGESVLETLLNFAEKSREPFLKVGGEVPYGFSPEGIARLIAETNASEGDIEILSEKVEKYFSTEEKGEKAKQLGGILNATTSVPGRPDAGREDWFKSGTGLFQRFIRGRVMLNTGERGAAAALGIATRPDQEGYDPNWKQQITEQDIADALSVEFGGAPGFETVVSDAIEARRSREAQLPSRIGKSVANSMRWVSNVLFRQNRSPIASAFLSHTRGVPRELVAQAGIPAGGLVPWAGPPGQKTTAKLLSPVEMAKQKAREIQDFISGKAAPAIRRTAPKAQPEPAVQAQPSPRDNLTVIPKKEKEFSPTWQKQRARRISEAKAKQGPPASTQPQAPPEKPVISGAPKRQERRAPGRPVTKIRASELFPDLKTTVEHQLASAFLGPTSGTEAKEGDILHKEVNRILKDPEEFTKIFGENRELIGTEITLPRTSIGDNFELVGRQDVVIRNRDTGGVTILDVKRTASTENIPQVQAYARMHKDAGENVEAAIIGGLSEEGRSLLGAGKVTVRRP